MAYHNRLVVHGMDVTLWFLAAHRVVLLGGSVEVCLSLKPCLLCLLLLGDTAESHHSLFTL